MVSSKSQVIWFTGMSGSGKSTLANNLRLFFLEKGYRVYVLDGDDVREKDSEKLGFGQKDVLKNNLRIAKLCLKLRKEYDVVVVPVISPYEGVRKQVRLMLQPNFHLIYLESDIGSLRNRDTKGLYSAADRGVISDLIGYSDINPYNIPTNAEIVIKTDNYTSIENSQKRMIDYINECVFT
jgi:adenylylsulfate kinase